ncbi:MAG: tRNA dihydrouridine synthase DusB [Nanoarchaeota archaeon]|nr:tRNA dihydrouridine synthase DusB [Nanoarchaeota archaeon]
MKRFPQFKEKAFLSPMARITDVAFRSICKTYGAGLTVTELINAKGILQNPESIPEICKRAPNEDFFSVQLFGDNPKDLARAGELVSEHCDMIDINLGCPAYKICRVGAGSQLLAHPQKVRAIVEELDSTLSIPVSVKMRTGLNDKNITVHEVAKAAQDGGACMVMVHGRTRDQMYTGTADWDIISQIKKELSIPVVGNGDITSPENVKERLEESGVDYVAIGRAASGNPLLFQRINSYLDSGSYLPITTKERLQVFEEYIKLSMKYQTSFLHQKIQAQHFTKGITGAAKLRLALNEARTSDELLRTVTSFIENE